MARHLFLGYFGFGNLGDQSILESAMREIQKKDADAAFVIAGKETVTGSGGAAMVGRLDFPLLFSEIRKCDSLVVAGGALQDSTSVKSLLYYLALMKAAQLMGRPVLLYGAGIGPIRSAIGRSAAKSVFPKINVAFVRDRNALSEFSWLGGKRKRAVLGSDAALCLPMKIARGGHRRENAIAVSVREPLGSKDIGELACCLNRCHSELGCKIILVAMQPADTVACGKVAARIGKGAETASPQVAASIFSKVRLTMGMRLHSLVFSALAATPFVALSYDPKVESFASEFGSPAFGCGCLDSGRFFEAAKLQLEKGWGRIEQRKLKKLQEKSKRAADKFARSLMVCVSEGRRLTVCKVPIHNLLPEEALLEAEKIQRSHGKCTIFTPNPEIISKAAQDRKLASAMQKADLLVPDGIGVVAASAFFGSFLRGRVTGIDLMGRMLDNAARRKRRVFLLGGKPGIAKKAAKNISRLHRGIRIAGALDGYFPESSCSRVARTISQAKPDLLFVGMGCPRQETWIDAHGKKTGARLIMAVGGGLDVYAGAATRAPWLLRAIGMEWAWRSIARPSRLAGIANFIRLVLAERLAFRGRI